MKRVIPNSPRGFTLIEALAAIAVMMIVIPVLLQGFTLAGSIASLTRKTADATALAQSTLDEMMATRNYDNVGTQQTLGVTIFDISSTLENWEQESNVQLLTVTVAWDHRGTRHTVALTSLVYQPPTGSTGLGNSPLTGAGFGP